MIPIQVLDQFHHPIVQRVDDRLSLLGSRDEFNHLLQSTRAMAIERNLDHLRGRVLDQHGALLIIGELEELLAQVIAEGICMT